jgi:hypothetical protein
MEPAGGLTRFRGSGVMFRLRSGIDYLVSFSRRVVKAVGFMSL